MIFYRSEKVSPLWAVKQWVIGVPGENNYLIQTEINNTKEERKMFVFRTFVKANLLGKFKTTDEKEFVKLIFTFKPNEIQFAN
jgi:hypothetical protein